ncbi:MAG TPA: glycosyltransferase family 9 protein [Candidatus Nanoarchaeia archaeon]|nr:glycosyltransferase family 9 protein [Candidatus Nanoarchaeia archaeon]
MLISKMLKKICRYIIRAAANYPIFFEISLRRRKKSGKKTMLLVKPEGIGDFILFYPTLRLYLEKFADYEVSFLASARNCGLAKELNDKLNLFSEIIVLDKEKFAANFFYRREFCLDIFKKNFSLVVYPTSWREPKCDVIIQASGADKKIVFAGDGYYSDWEKTAANSAYSAIIPLPPDLFREIDKYRYFAEKITGRKIDYSAPRIEVFGENILAARKALDNFGLSHKKFAVIFPGSADRYKIWPRERFARVIRFLLAQGLAPVVAGAAGDERLFSEIAENLRPEERASVADLCGQTSLLTLAAILKKAEFYFGSDTGALHLAAAVGCPTVCLMGGGHFHRFFPYGDLKLNRIVFDRRMNCRNDDWACARKNKNEPAPCIAGIKTEDAIAEIQNLLKNSN